MKLSTTLFLSLPVFALAFAQASDADACGGCFVPPMESTQVTGHRMILSVSTMQTTLYDQIQYAGDPSSFAWVLPTKGVVEIGLSSDALFAFLEQQTDSNVYPPPLNCPPPPACWEAEDTPGAEGDASTSSGAGGGSFNGGVSVIAQAVVGPYETVQLSATDPTALEDWLTSHGYALPADIKPVVDAYVSEGFDFLALKLVPGAGIQSMRPVRVTTPGAGVTLPLRMVAAGTGATTKTTLFVMGEGRYATQNFQNFTINPADVSWDWDTSEGNLDTLSEAGFAAAKGLAFLSQAGEPFSESSLQYTLGQVVQNNVSQSGYGDANGNGAMDEYTQDMAHLFSGIDPASSWITRLLGELPRAALATDLVLAASADQSQVVRTFQATKFTGTPPACETYPPCPPDNSSTTGAGMMPGGLPWLGSGGSAQGTSNSGSGSAEFSSSCAIGGGEGMPATAAAIGLLAALAMVRRRKAIKG